MPENAHKPRQANPTIRLALAGMMAKHSQYVARQNESRTMQQFSELITMRTKLQNGKSIAGFALININVKPWNWGENCRDVTMS